tara:strand:+ start:255528 stop:256226 length:699 start_codon:yes stop_codon:yes gene_type:complete
MNSIKNHFGVIIALIIIMAWAVCLVFALNLNINFSSPFTYLLVFLQMHLYTGLFITAHDGMHGTISKNRQTNKLIGTISALLFSFNFYHKLFPKHHEHHRYVTTDKDPDYHHGSFFPWYFSFLKQYITWQQIVLMAISFNVLKLYFPVENLILFWMLPAVLSTFQLFYFGTYLPHKGHHAPENKHFSRSQSKNHLWAFLSCYFFGYHYEHHDSPGTPWWQLYKVKGKFNPDL